jgi:hypothetical protein
MRVAEMLSEKRCLLRRHDSRGGPHPLARGAWCHCCSQLKGFFVYGSRALTMTKSFIKKSKIKIHKSKIFLEFPNVPFNVVFFDGLDFFGLPQRKFLEWTRGNHL